MKLRMRSIGTTSLPNGVSTLISLTDRSPLMTLPSSRCSRMCCGPRAARRRGTSIAASSLASAFAAGVASATAGRYWCGERPGHGAHGLHREQFTFVGSGTARTGVQPGCEREHWQDDSRERKQRFHKVTRQEFEAQGPLFHAQPADFHHSYDDSAGRLRFLRGRRRPRGDEQIDAERLRSERNFGRIELGSLHAGPQFGCVAVNEMPAADPFHVGPRRIVRGKLKHRQPAAGREPLEQHAKHLGRRGIAQIVEYTRTKNEVAAIEHAASGGRFGRRSGLSLWLRAALD